MDMWTFRYLDIWIFGYVDIWIWDIYIYKTYMNTYQPCTAVSQLPAALRSPERKSINTHNSTTGFLNTYIVNLVDFHWFEVPLVFVFKRWAIWSNDYASRKHRISLLIIPWHIDPWPECQPELRYTWHLWSLNITQSCRSVLFLHRFVFTLKHFVLWGVACVVCVSVFKLKHVCFEQPSTLGIGLMGGGWVRGPWPKL